MATLELVRKKRNLVKLTEEYYNALSTNVQLSGANIKMVEISSVTANEGKSTTSVNLAAAFARAGHKTLMRISATQSCQVCLAVREKYQD